jgi:hypothetical protein
VECVIINNEKKPRMRTAKGPRKPKSPRMTVAQLAVIVNQLTSTVNNLAIEMRAGFTAVNQKIDKEVGEIKETLKRQE